jgi:hypothetical protein
MIVWTFWPCSFFTIAAGSGKRALSNSWLPHWPGSQYCQSWMTASSGTFMSRYFAATDSSSPCVL